MIGTTKLFSRFLSLLGPKMLSTLIAFLSTPIIVRLLGPGDYGDYAVLLSIYSLYMIPISSSISEGVQKFVAEDRPTEVWVERVVQFYFALALLLATVGAAVLVLANRSGLVTRTFGSGFGSYIYVLAGFVFVGQFRGLSTHTILGLGLEHIKGPLEVLKKGTTVALGIVLVTFGFGVVGMLIGHIVANVFVGAVAGYAIVRRISPRQILRRHRSAPYRDFISFNAMNVVLVLLVMSLFHVDIVMVRTLIGDEATGYYKAALALAEYIWIVPIVLQSLLLHSSSTLWSDNRQGEVTELAGRITRYTVLLVTLLAIGLAALADSFVPIYYGESFVVATSALLLLLPGTIGFAVARPIQAISQGSGQLKPLILATAAAATLNLVLNASLIPRFGINGAAVATSCSYGSMFVFLVWASRRIGFDPLVDLRSTRVAATAVITTIALFSIDAAIGNDIASLAVLPVIGLVLFSGVAILTGAIDVEEVRHVLDRLPFAHEKRP